MSKKTFFIILSVFIGLAVVYGVYCFIQKANAPTIPLENNEIVDPLNAIYNIENQPVSLVNGQYQAAAAPGSAIVSRYSVWNKPVFSDFNNDGVIDSAIIIINNRGGSGTFYYLVAALGIIDSKKAVGTNGIFLGDRITIRSISYKDGAITVNYLDRKMDEPMTNFLTIEMSLKFLIKDEVLTQIPDIKSDSQNCIKYNGQVSLSLCCESTGDFPNTCLIGACGCSPANSHQVQVCECQEGKCFDGSQCVDIK